MCVACIAPSRVFISNLEMDRKIARQWGVEVSASALSSSGEKSIFALDSSER